MARTFKRGEGGRAAPKASASGGWVQVGAAATLSRLATSATVQDKSVATLGVPVRGVALPAACWRPPNPPREEDEARVAIVPDKFMLSGPPREQAHNHNTAVGRITSLLGKRVECEPKCWSALARKQAPSGGALVVLVGTAVRRASTMVV